jgi:hypothetical protein
MLVRKLKEEIGPIIYVIYFKICIYGMINDIKWEKYKYGKIIHLMRWKARQTTSKNLPRIQ